MLKLTDTDADLTRVGTCPPARGEVLVLDGKVLDPTGKSFYGACVEIWQTDHQFSSGLVLVISVPVFKGVSNIAGSN